MRLEYIEGCKCCNLRLHDFQTFFVASQRSVKSRDFGSPAFPNPQ